MYSNSCVINRTSWTSFPERRRERNQRGGGERNQRGGGERNQRGGGETETERERERERVIIIKKTCLWLRW